MDFITIDFEIANSKLSSACSLGLVFVQDNKIVDEKYYLIQPPGMELDEQMTKIHGLSVEVLEKAPTFNEVWNEIKHYFHADNLIIAHNAQFDMSVLKSSLLAYSIDSPEFPYIDSISISTQACQGEGIGNSLADRTKRFGIIIDEHHNALSDAKACAELVIKSVESQNRKSIQTYLYTHRSIPIRLFSELNYQTEFMKKKPFKFKKVPIKDIQPTVSEFDNNHPFYERNLVFTGDLQSISRKEAMQKAVDVGAIIKSGVSGLTDYLIVGKQDKSIVGEDGLSSKEEKAYDLIEKGKDIKIIDEDEFTTLLETTKVSL